MDNFWKWLKKANARAVFYCLLVVLVGVIAWWTWKLMTPVRITLPGMPGVGSAEQTGPSLGLIEFMEAQKIVATNRAADLFASPESFVASTAAPKNVEPGEPPKTKVEPERPLPKAAPPRAKDVIQLAYRGMIMRDDGAPVALIWDSKSKHASFYPVGTNLFGLKIRTVEAEALSVDTADDSAATLTRGIPKSFSEGRHAD